MKSDNQIDPENKTESVVACIKGDDKFKVLKEVIDHSNFFNDIEKCFKKSGKDKDKFKVVIKPNFMVFLTKKDPSDFTDPQMVDFLVEKLLENGFSDIYMVESQNVLGQWYENRDVATVASACGYNNKNYKLVDLTLDAVPHKFDGVLGNHFVGKTWKGADYRISFAKNKCHGANKYTLVAKNIFGVTTCENKYYEYHKLKEWDTVTVDMIKAFPVHFGFIDAFYSADGAFGFRGDDKPKYTRTILSGKDMLAVDWVGAEKMGLNPMESVLMNKLVKEFGKPRFKLYGTDELYEDWDNIPPLFDKFDDAIEESYCVHSFLTHLIMFEPEPIFKEKNAEFFRYTRKILGLDPAYQNWFTNLIKKAGRFFGLQ